ncbi:hypothetical protein CFP56_002990 [Quercus suber]|uniref:Uncharacterized protein n=1 Tax=Quercus suber TaxID=58331 RepID=A0AAW0LDJ4_QUESU
MCVMSMLFARWKGAKITTEHPMHVLCAYRMSLASLRPRYRALHISYNDENMVWFSPCTLRHITKETSYWDTLIYTNCINALQFVEEIGWLTLDDACPVGNTSESAVRNGRQAGKCQGHGGRQYS